MTEPKFYSGPWNAQYGEVYKDNGKGPGYTDSPRVCQIITTNGDKRSALANLNLIVAAPDMYDACKWALWLLNQPEFEPLVNDKWGDPQVIKEKLEKCIMKADGNG